jgi:hypothetical protein
MKLEFKDDFQAIAQLSLMGLNYERRTVAIESIDKTESRKHTGRLTAPVNTDIAKRYAECMKKGDIFPALIGWQTKQGKIILLGGNHRHEAAEIISAKTLDICLLKDKPSEEVMTMLPRVLNRTHGIVSTDEEAESAAIVGIKQYGWPIQKAAELLKLSEGTVKRLVRSNAVSEAIAQRGLNPKQLTRTHLNNLASLPNENVIVQMAKVAIDSKISADELAEDIKLVTKVKRSEIDQLAKVAEIARARTLASPLSKIVSRNGSHDRTVLLKGLTGMERSVKDIRTLEKFEFDDSDLKLIKGRLLALSTKLHLLSE